MRRLGASRDCRDRAEDHSAAEETVRAGDAKDGAPGDTGDGTGACDGTGDANAGECAGDATAAGAGKTAPLGAGDANANAGGAGKSTAIDGRGGGDDAARGAGTAEAAAAEDADKSCGWAGCVCGAAASTPAGAPRDPGGCCDTRAHAAHAPAVSSKPHKLDGTCAHRKRGARAQRQHHRAHPFDQLAQALQEPRIARRRRRLAAHGPYARLQAPPPRQDRAALAEVGLELEALGAREVPQERPRLQHCRSTRIQISKSVRSL